MAQKAETRLTKQIIKSLRKHYPHIVWVKIHGGAFQRAGISDIVGIVAALEVKCPGKEGTITPLQSDFLEEVNTAGGVGALVTSPEEALRAIEKMSEKT